MSEEQKQLATTEEPKPMMAFEFFNKEGFAIIQRMAQLFAASDLVPVPFKGNIANCVIGLEMAQRLGASPLAVMQNLYIVHNKPSWSAQFIIAAVNATNKFSPIRFAVSGEGDDKTCIAWAIEKATGERLEGPPVSIKMAKLEKWYDKTGSKWQTMDDLMLRYRAATFFGRLYAPEILMGMQTIEEVSDTFDMEPEQYKSVTEKTETAKDELKKRIRDKKKDETRPPEAEPSEPEYGATVTCPPGGPKSGEQVTSGWCKECEQRPGCPAWPVEA